MPSFDELIGRAAVRPAAGDVVGHFVPPPRFAEKRFETYRPDPRHPSQEAARARLRALAASLEESGWQRLGRRVRGAVGRPRRGAGVYLDGGFGVGKTHLLAALWNAAPGPKAYLSFDELVYTLGLLGIEAARAEFKGMRLIAVDEWELDDPGNLQLALAFLRGALADGVRVVTTSNAVPHALDGRGFSQKDFRAEMEELAAAFEVLRIQGEDFRHRRFAATSGREKLLDPEELAERAELAGEGAVFVGFEELLAGLERVHPIRFATLVRGIDALFLDGLAVVTPLPRALRWVHFIDKLYDAAVPLHASGTAAPGEIFPESYLTGPYGKKFSRCLSRLEELLGASAVSPPRAPAAARSGTPPR